MPISSPSAFSSGPPELPGLIEASVCRKPWNTRSSERSERSTAESTPVVTVFESPKGLPIAITGSPTRRSDEAPGGVQGTRLRRSRCWSTARSLFGSAPTSRASNWRPSARVTWMRSAVATTCSLVSTWRCVVDHARPSRGSGWAAGRAARRSRGRTTRSPGCRAATAANGLPARLLGGDVHDRRADALDGAHRRRAAQEGIALGRGRGGERRAGGARGAGGAWRGEPRPGTPPGQCWTRRSATASARATGASPSSWCARPGAST